MLLLAVFAFSQCKGMSTIDKKQSERSTKYHKVNSSPAVVASVKSTPNKDLESPGSHLHRSNSNSKYHSLPHHHSNSKKRRHASIEDDDVWTEHLSSSGRIYYYHRKTDASQWEKPKGIVKKLKPDAHVKGESKSHSKPSDSHNKSSSESHFKPVDSHSKPSDFHAKSADSHSKSLDHYSDRKHGHHGGALNKHHRDHFHVNLEHRSNANAHRSSSGHSKKLSEHTSSGSSRESQQQLIRPSRTPQKLSTGSESCPSPVLQERNVPCSSPMVQPLLPQQQLCPLTLKPMIPCQPMHHQQQQQHQSFPPNQPAQFMSPLQQHQPPFMSQNNGPPMESGGMRGPYRPWPPPVHLPPMHSREQQGVYPPIMSPLLPTVFSPGGGLPCRSEPLPPHPTMSMDNLSQGLHPLQQAFLLQNQQQHSQAQLVTPVNTPVGTPIRKPLLGDLSLPPLPSKNTPHTPIGHPHSNPSTPRLHKLGGVLPYQLFPEQLHARPSFDRTHSLPGSSKDLMEQFQSDTKLNVAKVDGVNKQGSGNLDISKAEEQESEQQKMQIGLDYFNKPLTEFWLTPAYDSLEKQLNQSSVDSLTHKHLEGRRISGLVKRFVVHSNAKQLRSYSKLKRVGGIRKITTEFLNKR